MAPVGPPPGGSGKLAGTSGLTVWKPWGEGEWHGLPEEHPGCLSPCPRTHSLPRAGGVQTGLSSDGLQWALSVWTRSAQRSTPSRCWSLQAASPTVWLRLESCSVSALPWNPDAPATRGLLSIFQFSSVQSLSRVQLFVTPWTAARQASLSLTISQSLLKLMSIKLVMSSNHLILCLPLLLPLSIFPSIRVFFNKSVLHVRWPKYWSLSISPSSEYSGLISFRMDRLDPSLLPTDSGREGLALLHPWHSLQGLLTCTQSALREVRKMLRAQDHMLTAAFVVQQAARIRD